MAFDYKLSVTLFHLIVIVPLLISVGLKGPETRLSVSKSSLNQFTGLIGFGSLGLIYHGLRSISNYQQRNYYFLAINLMHICLMIPILYVGYYQTQVKNPIYYKLLLILGFVAMVIHGLKLFTYVHTQLS